MIRTIRVTYSEEVSCRYVRSEVVYDIHVVTGALSDDAGKGLHIAPTADCAVSTDIWSAAIVLTIPAGFFQLGQSGTISITSGGVIDHADNPQPSNDSVDWVAAAPA